MKLTSPPSQNTKTVPFVGYCLWVSIFQLVVHYPSIIRCNAELNCWEWPWRKNYRSATGRQR